MQQKSHTVEEDVQGVTKWNTYIRSYLIRRFFPTYERLVFRSCTSAYVEYVNHEYVLQCIYP